MTGWLGADGGHWAIRVAAVFAVMVVTLVALGPKRVTDLMAVLARAPKSPMSNQGVWTERAQEALEQALSEVRDGEDALPSVSLADACLRAEQGAMGADELADLTYFYERPEPECTCPPDLVARGGFRGGCPACALRARAPAD